MKQASKELILDADEIRRLSRALSIDDRVVAGRVPPANADVPFQFAFIGWLLEQVRSCCGFGVDVTLVSRESAKQMISQYTAMAYAPDGAPCIDTVICNRGPAVAVALAIINASESL